MLHDFDNKLSKPQHVCADIHVFLRCGHLFQCFILFEMVVLRDTGGGGLLGTVSAKLF